MIHNPGPVPPCTSSPNPNRIALAELRLDGNVGSIPCDSLAWLVPLPATVTDAELRAEFESKGVVHVKGVMPPSYVLEHRKRYFEAVGPTGILKPGTDIVDGIWNDKEDPGDYVGLDNAKYIQDNPRSYEHIRLSLEAQQAEWSNEFCRNKYIQDVVHRIKPEWRSPFVFRRQIWRTNIPGATRTATGVHYDHIFLRAGPPTAVTAWVPVGDCSPSSGGLMYLSNSVDLGREIEDGFTRLCRQKAFSTAQAQYAFNENMGVQGMLSCDPGEFARVQGQGRKWLIGDYEAGDVVFHHSYMIHASTGNQDPEGRIRLSADLRYADRDSPHDTRWDQGPFRPDDGL